MATTNNKTIAKNTLYLYVRMILIMIVSLYTSRVILQVLGVNDYGIYQAVGGIVGFISFLNSALSTGTSRFLAYELGTGDYNKLCRTFSTLLTAHIILALIVIAVAELLGGWLILHKLQIPAERMDAAIWVFHLSMAAAFFRLILVPYNAIVIAHEKMSFFAYTSIGEVFILLGIVYVLRIGNVDKLILYAALLVIVPMMLLLVYVLYTGKYFKETTYHPMFDKKIFKPIVVFSSWSLLTNGSIALNNQGILLLLGMFFSPAVVAARAISLQVNMALNQFINNVRLAVTPPIIKQYAIGNKDASENLCISSTRYTYYLMLALCLPAFFIVPFLLDLWLGSVPDYTIVFVQIIIIQCLFQVFDSSLYTALYTVGRIKENTLLSPLISFLQFPIIYVMFSCGFSPVVLSWTNLAVYVCLGLIIKPILAVKIAKYNWRHLIAMFKKCFFVTIVALPIPCLLSYNLNQDTWQANLLMLVTTFVAALFSIYIIGLDIETRKKLISYIKKKVFRG